MLKEGTKAPAFNLLSDTGHKISLKDFEGKYVVLYFYPKDMTPGCTQQACDYRDSHAALKKMGAVVLGVSKDSVDRHVTFKEKYDLSFPLLSDESGKMCEAYKVWKEKSLYGRKYMGIERTTFIINPKGKIIKIFPKVKVNGHVKEVVSYLSSLPD
jgi:peroxiredoxin Q/BCP